MHLYDQDEERLRTDVELALLLGDELRCGCIWYAGRHAIINSSCKLHSPIRPWGLIVLKAARWYRPLLIRMFGLEDQIQPPPKVDPDDLEVP